MGAAASSAAKGAAQLGKVSRLAGTAGRDAAAVSSKGVKTAREAAEEAAKVSGKEFDEVAFTAAQRTNMTKSFQSTLKNPLATKAEKMAAQQGLKDLGVKRGASGFAFRPDGSPKIGNIVKVAASTGIAGVVAWMTFRGLGGVPGSEQLGDIVETDPNAGGMLDMGSPQFAWMSICACCCLCCVCLVLLIVAMSA